MAHRRRLLAALFGLALGLGVLAPVPAAAAGAFITISGQSFMVAGSAIRLRGINMNNEQALGASIGSGRLSDINVGQADYARVAGWGMNLVRFGLSFNWYQADRTRFFQAMDAQVAAAKSQGVYLMPVMFTTPGNCYEGYGHSCGLWGSSSEQQALSNFWKDFAQHYASETGVAGYDLLNEPTPPSGISQWFSLAQSTRDALTSVDANHFVVIEAGADSQFQATLGTRVVYSVHGYAPLSMTTSATPGTYSYPGYAPDWNGTSRYWSYQAMTDSSTAVYMGSRLSLDWARSKNVPMFYGEFGTQPFGNGSVHYSSDQIDIAERWQAAWTIFVYREFSYRDFGIYYGPASAPVGDPSVSVKQDYLDMLIAKMAALKGGTGGNDNSHHLYTLDGKGGLHPVGDSPSLSQPGGFSRDIARSMALLGDGSGGYVLDGFGILHQFGAAAPVTASASWPGWDIAREVVLAPWATASSPAGWVLDGYGGLHPFGGAPALATPAYWAGWDIARGVVVLPDSTQNSIAGYLLDGYGGLHRFGGAPTLSGTPYFGWNIARSVALLPSASRASVGGYLLDGFGGVHPFGNAPAAVTPAYWPGWDIAHSLTAYSGSNGGGWVLDGYGGLHPFGGAPQVSISAYWPGYDIARASAGSASGSGYKPGQ